MAKMVSRASFLLLTIFLSANQALAFPLPVKHPIGSNLGGSRVTLPELAFYSVSIVVIIFLFVGVYVQSAMTEARALAIFRRLHRNAITRLRRLHAISPFAASDVVDRAALVPRRVRRGGLAYPMSASRARWYPRPSRHALPV